MDPPTNSNGQSGDKIQGMQTHFYWDYKLQVLVGGWSTQTMPGYVLSLAAIFIMALFHEWFAELKRRLMKISPLPPPPPPPPPTLSSAPSFGSLPKSIRTHITASTPTFKQILTSLLRKRMTRLILLTLTHVAGAACGFLLMLAIMSYNAGVFLSALAGLGFGYMLFQTNHL